MGLLLLRRYRAGAAFPDGRGAGCSPAPASRGCRNPGKEFFAFAQEAWQEAGRVSWPTRKETIQTTAVVFAFVVVMALFLFAVDSTLAWLVKMLTGRVE